MSDETFFPNPPTPILKKGRWNPFKITVFWLEVITLRRELKIWHAVEYFDELGGVSSGGESLCVEYFILLLKQNDLTRRN